MTDNIDGVKKVAELIKDIRTCMLVTLTPEGYPHSRPMVTQEAEFDGAVWFVTGVDSPKVRGRRGQEALVFRVPSPTMPACTRALLPRTS